MGMANTSAWKQVILRELCHLVNYGYTASASGEPVGPKFLRITDIVPDLIDWTSVPYCQIPDKECSKYLVEDGDIVIARTGATSGYAKYLKKPPEAVFASYLVRLRISQEHDSRFVGLIVESNEYKRFIMSNIGGAAQPQANAQVLTSFPLRIPPLPIQRKIASILSAYDDLIENNTRRIKLLEEMAQSLYREWFVHFRFPGHEGVRLVESELGLVPEGWEVVPFTQIADVLSGGTPSTVISEYWNGDIGFFTPRDISASFYVLDTERKITEQGLRRCSSEFYPKDTVFITARGTVGKVALPAKPMAMSQTSYALRGRDNISQYFVFLAISNAVVELKQRSHGAVFDTIIVDTFRRLESVLPPEAVIDSFSNLITPLFGSILNLQQKNANLRRTRDLLLPKLTSGEVDVD